MKRSLRFLGLSAAVVLVFAVILALLVNYDDFSIIPLHFALGAALFLVFALKGGLKFLNMRKAGRVWRFGLGATVYTLLFLGTLVVVNVISARNQWLHYDSTEEKVYTLAPQTEEVLSKLSTPVLMRGFYLGSEIDSYETEKLIQRISRSSKNVRFELIDPEKSPGLLERLGIQESGTLHFSFIGDTSKNGVQINRDVSEQKIVNAIRKLTRAQEKIVYFLTGHGEPKLADEGGEGMSFLKEAIEGDNLRVEELFLAQVGVVPEDASAIVLAAPSRRLVATELDAIKNYISRGGHAVLLHDPSASESIRDLAKEYGIVIGRDAAISQVVRMFQGPTFGVDAFVTQYGKHGATRNFDQGTQFSVVSSVRGSGEPPADGAVEEIAFTGQESWAEKDLELLFSDEPTASFDEGDLRGPFAVAAVFEASANDAKVVVVGDADFVTNNFIHRLFNRDFFLNALNWTIGEAQGVTIRARTMRESMKSITHEQFNLMFLVLAILLPELLLITGLGVWCARRT